MLVKNEKLNIQLFFLQKLWAKPSKYPEAEKQPFIYFFVDCVHRSLAINRTIPEKRNTNGFVRLRQGYGETKVEVEGSNPRLESLPKQFYKLRLVSWGDEIKTRQNFPSPESSLFDSFEIHEELSISLKMTPSFA